MATNKLKFGTETLTKLYMGATEVTKAYMGDVLVYETSKQDELAGTWVFNDYVNIDTNFSYTLSFISNNIEFSRIVGQNLEDPFIKMITLSYAQNAGPLTNAFYNESWGNIAYKTITITSKLSEVSNASELLAWLQANATKQ